MLRVAVITISLFFCTLVNAKYIYEYMRDIEPLLLSKEYKRAQEEFDSLDKRIRLTFVGKGSVFTLYQDTVKWLKHLDKMERSMEEADKSPLNFTAEDGVLYQGNCSGQCLHLSKSDIYRYMPKSSIPFSEEFVHKINNRAQSLESRFNGSYKLIAAMNARESQRIAEENRKKIEDQRLQREMQLARERAESEALVKKEESKREQERNLQNEKLNNWAKSLGYIGYEGKDIVSLMYITQRDGGLENQVGKIYGCDKSRNDSNCVTWYPKVKVIQVTEKAVMYSFSEYAGNTYLDFTLLAERVPGRFYQEGQSLQPDFYAFKGMVGYETVTGVYREVPYFELVKPQP